jgi:hypothetical protein
MGPRHATLITTGARIDRGVDQLEQLYQLARELYPDGFTAEETRTFDLLREHVSMAFADSLRRQVADKLALPLSIFSLDRFFIYGCGPIALHDDRHNYPGVYFVIIVAHSGRLGVVDAGSRAVPHAVGEILLLDPYRRHALVREGSRAKEHSYERTHSPVHDPVDQFLFLDFDVRRRDLRERFQVTAAERQRPAG